MVIVMIMGNDNDNCNGNGNIYSNSLPPVNFILIFSFLFHYLRFVSQLYSSHNKIFTAGRLFKHPVQTFLKRKICKLQTRFEP